MSNLYKKALESRPLFYDNAEAHAHYSKKLDKLARQQGLTPDALFEKAENSAEWTDELAEAHHLYILVSHLKEAMEAKKGKKNVKR